MGGGKEAAEVGIAGAGLSEKDQVVGVWGRKMGENRLYLHFSPKDGFYAETSASFGKTNCPIETVMIGEGQSRLTETGCAEDQVFDVAPSVQEREIRVHVQVHKRSRVGVRGGRGRKLRARRLEVR